MGSTGHQGHFVALDQLRGAAAVLVLLDHAGCILFGVDLVPRNLLAVQFFFMLSGFVLASGYEDRLRAGLGIFDFLRRRMIRLYPLVVLGAVFGAAVLRSTDPGFATDPGALLAVLLAMLCLPSPDGSFGFGFGRFPVNPPEWSLFFELLANVGFAVIAPRLSRSTVAIFAIGACLLYSGMAAAVWPEALPFWREAIGATGAFGTGIAIWRWLPEGPQFVRSLPVSVLGLTLTSVCMLPEAAGPAVTPVAMIVVFPAVIALGAAKGRDGRPSALGALSYPLYILHWPVLLLVRAWLLPVAGPYVSFGVGCAAAFGIAFCGQHLFNWRVRAGVTSLLARVRPNAAARALTSRPA